MKHTIKTRAVSLILGLLLLLGMFPVTVLAETDTAAPELKTITLSTDTLTAPGTIDLVLDASDDVSGITSVSLGFYCEQTQRRIYCYPSSTYLDMKTGQWVPYADGKFHGTLVIDQFVSPGTFVLNSVNLHDKAGNSRSYSRSAAAGQGNVLEPLPEAVKSLEFTVTAAESADTQAPALNDVTLEKTRLTAPGTIGVAVDAQDDVSGILSVSLIFYCEATGKAIPAVLQENYWSDQVQDWVPYEDGMYHGQLEIDEYVRSGVFLLSSVTLYDKAGNSRYYSRTAAGDSAANLPLPEKLKNLQFTVDSTGATDTDGPVLKNVTLSAAQVTAPGTVDVVVEATDDVSGISSMSLRFYCEETKKSINCMPESSYWDETTQKQVPYEDGKFRGKLEIDGYTQDGVFRLSSVNLHDNAGNSRYYNRNAASANDPTYASLPENLQQVQFTVGDAASQEPEASANVTRIAGADRYATAFAAADELKKVMGTEKFANIVVASGTTFPDALAGSYLACVKNAPILLVKGGNTDAVKQYIRENLTSGGTVYLLGGTAAIPKTMESGLDGYTVKRLGGNDRYETNLLILKEAGVSGKDLVVCTGKNFADSLSASAVGLPILLVKDSLNDAQKEFLKGTTGRKIIIGGKNAVSEETEKQLAAFGQVKRLAGVSRYDTSTLVAEEFFPEPDKLVLAYGKNFPDGLSGGPLACNIKAPLILTQPGSEVVASTYRTVHQVDAGYVLGGTTVLPESTVNRVFGVQ